MLTDEIKRTIAEYADGMTSSVSIVLNPGEHEKRQELVEFIESVARITDSIKFFEREFSDHARSPLTFMLEVDGEPTGIYFSGIPGGHEFNTFILAVLQSGGVEIKLEDGLKQVIANIPERLSFETFVSLSCHNCPDVVQALNQFALLNQNISSEMIDGGLFPEIITERGIQGVPSVYLNGELFANGRVEVASLIDKISVFHADVNKGFKNKISTQDVVVVGGGPAGISSAIYASRKGLNVTVVTKTIGGQLKETLGIENFISVSKTTGPELTNAIQNHMNDYHITVKEHVSVERVALGALKVLTLSSGEVIQGRTIIVATGANWKKLGIPGEQENIGNGVAYCPHCDGPFYKEKDVAVIGGGNSGVEAALDLGGIVNSVTLLEFLPELKADQVLIDQLVKRENISVVRNARTERILSENGKVLGLEYEERNTKEIKRVDISGVFVQIGLVPNSEFVDGILNLNEFGEIIVDKYCNTSVEGIYACGDVTSIPYKQIIMAMGEGSKAAITAADYLQKNPVEQQVIA
ncbi:MAG: NADH dehydrogenase [Alphaproteobacteria bacterium MarineAlpha4_Bin2]|nr:MAG: NADH dehydrogenase [Alphaproteobacteria bacterium MarineAlpha4_Bin2]